MNVLDGFTLELDFRLGFSPIVLDSVVVEVAIRSERLLQQGFYDRMRRGWGRHFHG